MLPRIQVIQPGEQVDDCGFACPGWSNQGNRLSGFGVETHSLKHRNTGNVAELRIFELDVSFDILKSPNSGQVRDLWLWARISRTRSAPASAVCT